MFGSNASKLLCKKLYFLTTGSFNSSEVGSMSYNLKQMTRPGFRLRRDLLGFSEMMRKVAQEGSTKLGLAVFCCVFILDDSPLIKCYLGISIY